MTSVKGKKEETDFIYVNKILYDEYGQRIYIEYGNGTKTNYEYDEKRRWLDNIQTQGPNDQYYQNIKYIFDKVGNVKSYENNCLDEVLGNYKTKQNYDYDELYQLKYVHGETTYNPYGSSVPEHISTYEQHYKFDTLGLGNMTSKKSTNTVSSDMVIGDNLNYDFNYVYDPSYAHRLINAGNRYYKYDSNGNIICEQEGPFDGEETVTYHKITQEAQDVYSTEYGWGLFNENNNHGNSGSVQYRRTYTWDEKNQLISSVDDNYSTSYVYGQDGQRTNKYTSSSETLYFNKMWTLHTDSGNNSTGGQYSKNIYLGDTRIVTKLRGARETTTHEEINKQYYYHSDHLGSASLITDCDGKEYQRIEYTPYGETWVEKTQNTGLEYLPYKFTAKEQDEETGLYYYGARYLDPKYSMWISTDPALGDYIPQAPVSDAARQNNQNLPGMGGIFNHINSNLYAYAANNPVHYMDPDGKSVFIDCTEDEDGKRTLKEINKYSYSQYQIDENGYLYKTDKINKKGSKLYSEAIDRCIEDENSEVTIRYIKTPYAVLYKNLIDVKSFGGATTFFNANESDPSEVYIFFMNKGLSDKFKWNINAARILMHEIVGHADPIIAGGPRDNENAIENENAVLDQLNRPNQKREVKQWHTAR